MAISNGAILELAAAVSEIRNNVDLKRNGQFSDDVKRVMADQWTAGQLREQLDRIAVVSDELMEELRKGTTS